MKRLILIIAAVLLVAAGVFCGFKYYFDVYLPNKEITDAEKEQREYYEQLKPTIPWFRLRTTTFISTTAWTDSITTA